MGGSIIFDLGNLKKEEELIFLNVNKDVLNNNNYTEYCLVKENNELVLKFQKRTSTKHFYRAEFVIQVIKTIKRGSQGILELPNFISKDRGDILEGVCKEGFTFRFENIVSISIGKKGEYQNAKLE